MSSFESTAADPSTTPGAWSDRVHAFVEIDSTNRWMRDEAAQGRVHHGAVAIADLQTAGRGRLDRKWVAPPRSALLMSVLVDSAVIALPIERWPLVSMCMALAVETAANDLIASSGGADPGADRPVALKWPNDVIVPDQSGSDAHGYRKLSGILVEVSSGRLVVGVGVNLERPTEIDPSLGVAAKPIWLNELTNSEIDRDGFAQSVVAEFFRLVIVLRDSPGRLLEAYREVLATLGWVVRIESQGREWTAKAVDVDDHGRLVVESDEGTHHLDVSEVVHVRPVTR